MSSYRVQSERFIVDLLACKLLISIKIMRKDKLLLCLVKHPAMNTYLRAGMIPRILNLSSR
jgi:hypothetical protein